MKQLIKLSFLLAIFSCKSYAVLNVEELSVEGLEPGKCYFTIQVDGQLDREASLHQESFILEVEPTKFEEYEAVYSCTSLKGELIEIAM